MNTLPQGSAAIRTIGGQLVRCGISVGSNYRAVCRSRSRAEFISRMGIVEEEADESDFWMELLVRSGYVKLAAVEDLMKEASAIVSLAVHSHGSLPSLAGMKLANPQASGRLIITTLGHKI